MPQVRSLVGTKLGYSQLSRIEDTMTSIGMFSRGFKSVYINEEDELLGRCTQEPDSMDWYDAFLPSLPPSLPPFPPHHLRLVASVRLTSTYFPPFSLELTFLPPPSLPPSLPFSPPPQANQTALPLALWCRGIVRHGHL